MSDSPTLTGEAFSYRKRRVARLAAGLALASVAGMVALLLMSGWGLGAAQAFVGLGFFGTAMTVVLWACGGISIRAVLLGAVVLRLLVLPVPPSLSSDAFRYLWDGMVQHAGINPYQYLPSDPEVTDLGKVEWFDKINSPGYFSVYPPISQGVFYLGAAFAPWSPAAGLMATKLLFLLMEGAGLWALSRMVRGRDLVLYAWNPLVVVAMAGQAHTETGMVGMLLLALWAARRERGGLASLALASAGMIKLYPFLLFPLLHSRFGWRGLWPGGLLALGLGVAYLNPELGNNLGQSLRLYFGHFEFNAGPYFVLRDIGWRLGLGDPRPVVTALLAVLFAVIGLSTWWWHRRGRIGLEVAALIVFGSYIVTSRTLHPWYLAGVLAVLPLVPAVWRWPWIWLGACSLGTYLFYVDGTYWLFVWIGWLGWAAGMLVAATTLESVRNFHGKVVDYVLLRRVREKLVFLTNGFGEPRRVLDLGAAEGFLGDGIAARFNCEVELVDVSDRSRSALPARVYDGKNLPYEDGRFDVTVICYVLHHAEDADRVLEEARRVTRGRVVVIESWARGPLRERLLVWTDRAVNSLRGGGWSDPIRYRRPEAWGKAAADLGYLIVETRDLGGWFHAKARLVLEVNRTDGGLVGIGEC